MTDWIPVLLIGIALGLTFALISHHFLPCERGMVSQRKERK